MLPPSDLSSSSSFLRLDLGWHHRGSEKGLHSLLLSPATKKGIGGEGEGGRGREGGGERRGRLICSPFADTVSRGGEKAEGRREKNWPCKQEEEKKNVFPDDFLLATHMRRLPKRVPTPFLLKSSPFFAQSCFSERQASISSLPTCQFAVGQCRQQF